MKTESRNENHKRTLSSDRSCLPVSIKQEPKGGSLCSIWLQHHGYVQSSIPDNTADTLSVAVAVFQAQLQVYHKQPPEDRRAGSQQLARKQRLEFCAEHSALGQLGLLQGLATTVQDLQSPLKPLSCHCMHAVGKRLL